MAEKNLFPKIKAEMVLRGEGIPHLCILLGVSAGAVSKRFTGKTEWSIRDIDTLCKHYGKSYEELFK